MTHLEQIQNKIVNKEDLLRLRNIWDFQDKKVVFTNGCFDFLHIGHIEYLSKASDLGKILVIGLNTDDSVSRLKGPSRPVNKEEHRAIALASLSFVSYVVLFDEDTPEQLIEDLKPDVLAKGADYTIELIVGAKFILENGGEVERIPLTEGFSTTALIEKLKKE